MNCQDFTTGQFCETCVSLYYRPRGKSKYDANVCVPCLCSEAGAVGDLDCEKVCILYMYPDFTIQIAIIFEL